MRFFIFSIILVVTSSVIETNGDVTIITANNFLYRKNSMNSILPINGVFEPSQKLALANCQTAFKWDPWNCPSNDFVSKRSSKYLDREVAYVKTLTKAAFIYTMTKNCSRGEIPECACSENTTKNQYIMCSDNPTFAENLLDSLPDGEEISSDAQGYANLHNNRAAKLAIRRALRRYCRCDDMRETCVQETCWTALKPFSEIAADIRQMYENAKLISADNTGNVHWQNIPSNILVYVQTSLNYCQRSIMPGWPGMKGRQCLKTNRSASPQERKSCRNLCRACGHRIRGQNVTIQKRCNCKLNWCFEVSCDICVHVEKQHYCD